MRTRPIAAAFFLWLMWPTQASAQTIDLRLTCRVAENDRSVRVDCTIENVGSHPATEVVADLWRNPEGRLGIVASLEPGGATGVGWQISPELWRSRYRRVAAVRVGYRNPLGETASVVVVVGRPALIEVEPPGWPEPTGIGLRWVAPPAPSGEVVWWGPAELAVLGGDRWDRAADVPDSATSASGALGPEIRARLSPSSRIDGWNTTLYAILLPDSESAGTENTLPAGQIAQIPIEASNTPLWQPDGGWITAFVLISVAGWLAWGWRSSRQSGSMIAAIRRSAHAIALVLTLGATALALVPLRLVFLETTPAGGDYASQIVALERLRYDLLPSARVYGWYPGWFAGFPLFIYYFPLAFLVGAALSLFLPLVVAMKLASLAGPALLPAAWFWTLRWLRAPPEAAWCAAAGSLLFLFIEEQAVWGGNIASTLSGEFAYALGFPLAWLAMAWAWSRRNEATGWWILGALLALTGLAHAYTLAAAIAGVLLVAFSARHFWYRAWNVARAGSIAFGLLAWWLIPLFWNLPWTNSLREAWPVTLNQAVPPILWPAAALAVIGVARCAMWKPERRQSAGRWWLAGFGLVSVLLFELGYSLGIADIRILPFAHGCLVLLGCWELGSWISSRRTPDQVARPVVLAGAIVAIGAFAVWHVDYVPGWVRWTFGGLERTPGWRDFSETMRLVEGPVGSPRVLAERHTDYELLGTNRVFELIPYFSERDTLEGLYKQAGLPGPATYYLQSQYAQLPSCPLPGYECRSYDPIAGLRHLRALGVDTVIAYTPRLSGDLAASADFARVGRAGRFTIYRTAEEVRLVEAARFQPVVDEQRDWRTASYDWFRAATDLDVPLLIGSPGGRWSQTVDRYRPYEVPRVPYPDTPSVRYRIDANRIEIETDTPGHPLVVKVSYHPGWRASDGSVIELIAPGFMLVTPTTSAVTLEWSSGAVGFSGLVLTLGTLLYLGWHLALRSSRRWQPPPTSGRSGTIGVLVAAAAAIAAAAAAYAQNPPINYIEVFAEGVARLREEDFAAAETSFQRLLDVETRHAFRDDAAFYLGLTALDADRPDDAIARWESFLLDIPVSGYSAEALVRMARIHRDRGDMERARVALERAAVAPLGRPEWIRIAREGLAAISATDPGVRSSGWEANALRGKDREATVNPR